MNASPASEIAGGARCVLERSSEMRDEGLLLRWTADHNAAAYERPRCADTGRSSELTRASAVEPKSSRWISASATRDWPASRNSSLGSGTLNVEASVRRNSAPAEISRRREFRA